MTWSTPPVHAPGDTLTASDWNIIADDLAVAAQYVGLFGSGASGAGPAALVQAGTNSGLAVPANGQVSFTLPSPFPNSLVGGWANPQGGSYTAINVRLGSSTVSTLALTFTPAAAGTGNFLWGAIGT